MNVLEETQAGKLVTLVNAVIEDLHKAQTENNRLQSMFVLGSPEWHACETIDDRLHDALSKLGD